MAASVTSIPPVSTVERKAVLLDIGLPGMDGYQIAQLLRREEELKGTILIAFTGYGEDEAMRRSREAGFDHHLVKPVNYDTLLDILIRASHHPGDNRKGCSSRCPREPSSVPSSVGRPGHGGSARSCVTFAVCP